MVTRQAFVVAHPLNSSSPVIRFDFPPASSPGGLKRAIRAAGGVLTLSWAGSLPTRVGDRDRPTQFQGTITIRIEDLPESDPEGRS
jgi:hypothetical protein